MFLHETYVSEIMLVLKKHNSLVPWTWTVLLVEVVLCGELVCND